MGLWMSTRLSAPFFFYCNTYHASDIPPKQRLTLIKTKLKQFQTIRSKVK